MCVDFFFFNATKVAITQKHAMMYILIISDFEV